MILIGLGANLNGKYGSPEEALINNSNKFASHGINIKAASHIWSSEPVPVSNQPWYKNAVCSVETSLSPQETLKILNLIEQKAGRIRTTQNASRVLDLDLLAYNDIHISSDFLKLPHPEMHKRAFVLYPLREVAPDWVHPTMDKSVDEMIYNLPKGQRIKRSDGVKLYPVRVDDMDEASV